MMAICFSYVFVLMLFMPATEGYFKCSRDPTLCKMNSTCNTDTQKCDCPPGVSGYDCSVVDSDVDQLVCSSANPCQNGATCHMNAIDTTPKCHCPEDFVGNTCESLRGYVVCENDQMNLTITPFVSIFEGSVYEVETTDTACAAEDIGGGTMRVVIADTEANCALYNDNKERCFYVMYNKKVFTTRDQKVCASCSGDTVEKSTGLVEVTDIDTNIESKTIGGSPIDTDVDLHLLLDGVDVTSPVVLGTELELFTYLTTTGVERFAAIRLQDCTAKNDDQSAPLNISLVENNCLADEMMSISRAPNRTDDGRNVSLTFEAFKFLIGTTVTIECTVKTCKLASECEPNECRPGEDPKTGYGRRKRQADSNSEEKTVNVKYTFLRFPSDRREVDIVKDDRQPCDESLEMKPIVVTLGVALLLVLLMTTVLTVKVISDCRKAKRSGNQFPPIPTLPTVISDKNNY